MKKNILKIDLDLKNRTQAVNQLVERISYFKSVFEVDYSFWKKIELVKKSRYGAKITLSKEINHKHLIILQLVFGSDWRKEINTFYNSEVLKMDYSNRLFTTKPYGNKLKTAEIEDITEEILKNLKNPRIFNLRRFIISKIIRLFKK